VIPGKGPHPDGAPDLPAPPRRVRQSPQAVV